MLRGLSEDEVVCACVLVGQGCVEGCGYDSRALNEVTSCQLEFNRKAEIMLIACDVRSVCSKW